MRARLLWRASILREGAIKFHNMAEEDKKKDERALVSSANLSESISGFLDLLGDEIEACFIEE